VITEQKRVKVPCKVKVAKQVPYEIEVNQENVTYENEVQEYYKWEPQTVTRMVPVTKRIPVVERKCTDATGKEVKNASEVPLHHSGPSPSDVNRPPTYAPTAPQ
jgi:hypothetical protein